MRPVCLNSHNHRIEFPGIRTASDKKVQVYVRSTEIIPAVYGDTPEGIEISKIYDNLWKELKLPKNLKPHLEFDHLGSNYMGFISEEFAIYINNYITPKKWNKYNNQGYTKAYLRHEIQHVIQLIDAIRVCGKDGYEKIAKLFGRLGYFDKEIYEKVLKTMGELSPDSKEGKKALKYIKAAENYKSPKGLNIISWILYKFNFLERDANNAMKPYMPNRCKLFLKGLIKIL